MSLYINTGFGSTNISANTITAAGPTGSSLYIISNTEFSESISGYSGSALILSGSVVVSGTVNFNDNVDINPFKTLTVGYLNASYTSAPGNNSEIIFNKLGYLGVDSNFGYNFSAEKVYVLGNLSNGGYLGNWSGGPIGNMFWGIYDASNDTVIAAYDALSNAFYYSDNNYKFSYNNNIHEFTGSIKTVAGFTGSLFGTSSWAQSTSQALTASYVNPLNQTVIITGSMILSSSAPTAVAGGIYYDGTHFYLGF